jgi:Flp pilus assembly protein TadD
VSPANPVAEPPKRAAASDLVERANAAFLDGREVAAATLVERAVGLDPTFSASYLLLARMHLERGDEELALTFLERAEQLAAGDPRVLADVESLRGVAFERLGRHGAAVAAYERALGFAPDNTRARGGLARLAGHRVVPD